MGELVQGAVDGAKGDPTLIAAVGDALFRDRYVASKSQAARRRENKKLAKVKSLRKGGGKRKSSTQLQQDHMRRHALVVVFKNPKISKNSLRNFRKVSLMETAAMAKPRDSTREAPEQKVFPIFYMPANQTALQEAQRRLVCALDVAKSDWREGSASDLNCYSQKGRKAPPLAFLSSPGIDM